MTTPRPRRASSRAGRRTPRPGRRPHRARAAGSLRGAAVLDRRDPERSRRTSSRCRVGFEVGEPGAPFSVKSIAVPVWSRAPGPEARSVTAHPAIPRIPRLPRLPPYPGEQHGDALVRAHDPGRRRSSRPARPDDPVGSTGMPVAAPSSLASASRSSARPRARRRSPAWRRPPPASRRSRRRGSRRRCSSARSPTATCRPSGGAPPWRAPGRRPPARRPASSPGRPPPPGSRARTRGRRVRGDARRWSGRCGSAGSPGDRAQPGGLAQALGAGAGQRAAADLDDDVVMPSGLGEVATPSRRRSSRRPRSPGRSRCPGR